MGRVKFQLGRYMAKELPPARRAKVVRELLDEQGEDRGAGRSAEVLALLAGMVAEDEAVGHLGRLAEVAPDAGIRALASVEGLDPVRWLGLLLEMKPEREGPDLWIPFWSNDHLDAVLDAIRRDGADRVGRLWEAVHQDLPAPRLGVLWYALERLDPAADLETFLRACGKADRERPKVPTCEIPAGRFRMGAADKDGRDHERPIHEVVLSRGFRLGTAPLTVAQLQAFDLAHDNGAWTDPQMPAVMVDWFTARLVAAWLGGRLPTEAEWEYACRAGTTSAYWSGNTEMDLARVGWYGGNSDHKLHPVGQKPANPWGLHDMHGNAWEWCQDRFGPLADPLTADPVGTASGSIRVLRGGCGWNVPDWCQSATRNGNPPGLRYDVIGLRVVLPARSPAG